MINGRAYADGGLTSLFSAELAAGHETVVVLSPMPLNDYLRAKLDVEVAVLAARTVRVVAADERALAVIGPDPNAASAALPALDAGLAQARREAAALRSAWPVRTQPLAGTWTAPAREPE